MTTDTLRLSDRMHATIIALAERTNPETGMTLSGDDARWLIAKLQDCAADVRSLERMLERRLRAADIPRTGGAPTAASEPGSNLVLFRPRADARVVPFGGGAA